MSSKITRSCKIVSALAVVLLLAITAWAIRPDIFAHTSTDPRTTSAQSRHTIGDLGGMPVRIPAEFARFVEYDDDPHFLDKAIRLVTGRTFQSKLRSFGFEVRFPDMKGGAPTTREESNIFTTMWMRVGINTGSNYGDGGDYLGRLVESIHRKEQRTYDFIQLPERVHELTAYTPIGVDVSRRDLAKGGSPWNDQDIFFSKDGNGNYDAFIECSNVSHSAAPCSHQFRIPGVKANIRVSYRRGHLKQWREIQDSVSKVILGFRTEP